MLSERERQLLASIAAELSAADQRFADGMRSGRPRAPREYRQTWTVVLMTLGVLAFGWVLFTGDPLGAVALVAVAVAALVRVVTRRLDTA
jgi:hypothetical protein